MKIVEVLKEIQKERKLTNKQMAESLDVHRESWVRNKKTNKIAAEPFMRASEAFPELLLRLVASDETPQNRNLGYLWGKLIDWIIRGK